MKKQKNDFPAEDITDLDADHVIDHEAVDPVVVPPAPTKTKKRLWAYGAAALLASGVAGGWFYKDVLSSYFPADNVKALIAQVAELDAKNAALRDQLSAVDRLAKQLTADVDMLEGKEQALAGSAEEAQKTDEATAAKLQAIEQSLVETRQTLTDLAARPAVEGATNIAPDAALQQRVATLEKDVASLKVKPAAAVDNTVALSQSLSDLKAKIEAGTGYRDEFDRIQRMVPAADGLDILASHATPGLPNANGLGAELKTLITDLPKPELATPAATNESWWDGLYRGLSDLITIKVAGEVDWPTTAAAAVALAESGDLPQAIEHINAVEATKPVGLQQWLDRATARIAVEKALQSVEEAVLRVIAAKG